jgi:hypothetical protein
VTPTALGQFTMPTALERNGNFSQSVDQNGKGYTVKDPLTGQPFPGNIVPANRLNPNGQALMNIFPLPNQLDRAVSLGAYNYQYQSSYPSIRGTHVWRVDYKPNQKDSMYFRGTLWESWDQGADIVNWPFSKRNKGSPIEHAVFNYTRVVTPAMVNEFNMGARRPLELEQIDDTRVTRNGPMGKAIMFGLLDRETGKGWYVGSGHTSEASPSRSNQKKTLRPDRN